MLVNSGGASDIGRTYRVGGIPISVTTLSEAIDRIVEWQRDPRGRYVCIRDLHGLVLAAESPQLSEIHQQADMVTPDGMPLVWIGRLRGLPVGRTSGPDLMAKLIARSAVEGLSQYFLGGRAGVAEQLAVQFREKYLGLAVAGYAELPFAPVDAYDLEAIISDVNASGANIVWVGLSTPRQEMLMHRIAARTSATFIGVGAAFDFHSGHVRRAPLWMQRTGLEWCFRILQDPARLGPRYFRTALGALRLLRKGKR